MHIIYVYIYIYIYILFHLILYIHTYIYINTILDFNGSVVQTNIYAYCTCCASFVRTHTYMSCIMHAHAQIPCIYTYVILLRQIRDHVKGIRAQFLHEYLPILILRLAKKCESQISNVYFQQFLPLQRPFCGSHLFASNSILYVIIYTQKHFFSASHSIFATI